MSYMISVYGVMAYREVLLPSVPNADYDLFVDRNLFGFYKDFRMVLENINGSWFFKDSSRYSIISSVTGLQYTYDALKDNDMFTVIPEGEEKIFLLVQSEDSLFTIYDKFCLPYSGNVRIGSSDECSIRYRRLLGNSPFISHTHAVITCKDGEYDLTDQSANGTFLNERRVPKEEVRLSFGDQISIYGLRMVFLGGILAVCPLPEGCTIRLKRPDSMDEFYSVISAEPGLGDRKDPFFRRSPRSIPGLITEGIEIEPPPPKQEQKEPSFLSSFGPTITMALPMTFGFLLTFIASKSNGRDSSPMMFTGIITAFSSSILGVFWGLMNRRHSRREMMKNKQEREELYTSYLHECGKEIKGKYENNRNALLKRYPAAESLAEAAADGTQLWNRNPRHEDFLKHRIGLGELPFQAEIKVPRVRFTDQKDEWNRYPGNIRNEYRMLKEVPICVDLLKNRLTGLIGGDGFRGCYPIVHSLVSQIAFCNCYTDVKMIFCFDGNRNIKEWEFTKWLPHTFSNDGRKRYLASDVNTAGEMFSEIAEILRIREGMEGNRCQDKTESLLPYYILFVEDMRLLDGELIAKYVFDPDQNYGLSTILLAENYDDLPNCCEFFIENTGRFQGSFHVTDNLSERTTIRFDLLHPERLDRMCRQLSGIRIKTETSEGEIPGSLSFFEMYGINSPEEFRVLERWRKNRTYDTLKALIGRKAGGLNCYLNVHEKYHGPHGLLAGTTGSGKSEMLQTFLLSLAINYSPLDVGFFIIDYKGGGMANLFEGLPHLLGQISNLSGTDTRRAMVSIKSENIRRQRIFNEYGVNNINLYTRLFKSGEADIPIPHLFIVIDEFAELKKEEPEFMKELISVAQVGRSLGVHLILATQKPAGCVDDNIFSNSRFRLCLRVQDKQDSMDMLHKPDASRITITGRGFLQVGNDELYEEFQSGWSGAPFQRKKAESDGAILLSENGSPDPDGIKSRALMKECILQKEEKKEPTELKVMVDYLKKTAEENNCNLNLKLWLKPLPPCICHEELSMPEDHKAFRIPIGRIDDPKHQSQKTFIYNPVCDGNLAVTGGPMSGKSSLLLTILYSFCLKYRPDEVNIYISGDNTKQWNGMEGMPHVGGILHEEDREGPDRFFSFIKNKLTERKEVPKEDKIPAIIIAIDNYGIFEEKTLHRFDDVLEMLLREGNTYGLYVIATSGGFRPGEIPGRISDFFKTSITLSLPDRYAYKEILRVKEIDVYPADDIPGRGLVRQGDTALEFQAALPVRSGGDLPMEETIRRKSRELAKKYKDIKAPAIPSIPKKPLWEEFIQRSDTVSMAEAGRKLPFGFHNLTAAVWGIPLSETYTYLITGRAGSGLTNALKILISSAYMMRGRIAVIDFGGELKKTALRYKAEYLCMEEDVFTFFGDILSEYKTRNKTKRELVEQGLSGRELFDGMQIYPKIFLIINDLSEFCGRISYPSAGVGQSAAFVINILEKGAMHNVYWFAASSFKDSQELTGNEVYMKFIKERRGICMGGCVGECRTLSFSSMKYTEQTVKYPPGTGVISEGDDNETTIVVAPLMSS